MMWLCRLFSEKQTVSNPSLEFDEKQWSLHVRGTAYLIWPSPWPYTEWRCAAKFFWHHRPFITFRLFFLSHCAHTKPGLLTKSVLISVWHLLQNVLAASVLCGQSTDDHILNEAMLCATATLILSLYKHF